MWDEVVGGDGGLGTEALLIAMEVVGIDKPSDSWLRSLSRCKSQYGLGFSGTTTVDGIMMGTKGIGSGLTHNCIHWSEAFTVGQG